MVPHPLHFLSLNSGLSFWYAVRLVHIFVLPTGLLDVLRAFMVFWLSLSDSFQRLFVSLPVPLPMVVGPRWLAVFLWLPCVMWPWAVSRQGNTHSMFFVVVIFLDLPHFWSPLRVPRKGCSVVSASRPPGRRLFAFPAPTTPAALASGVMHLGSSVAANRVTKCYMSTPSQSDRGALPL